MNNLSIAAALLALALSGCAEMIAAQRRADEQQCLDEGFRPQTDGFRLCRLTIEQIREKRAVEERRKRDEEADRRRWADERDRFIKGCTYKPIGTTGC